jgi:NAD(P)H-flavin reductase/ferredoxin
MTTTTIDATTAAMATETTRASEAGEVRMSYQVEIAGTDYRFACAADESVLDAAQRAGLELPYSCKKGICGNCRGKVTQGSVQMSGATEGLSPSEREAGFVLYCRAKPSSDLVLDPVEVRRADPSARRVVQAKVFRLSRPAPDVTILQLRFPAGKRVKFRAGQYLQILLDDGERRSFSMANSPTVTDGAQLHIRHVGGGRFSGTVLPQLEQGDTLNVELPYGDFYLREDSDKPIVFVASGTGFAPIQSIVDYAIARDVRRPMHLYWGARREEDLYALDVPARWIAKRPDFRFVPVLSEPDLESGWTGRTGLVHRAVMDDHATLADVQVYACGAPVMTRAAREDFTTLRGLPEAEFFSDAFVQGPAMG